LDPLGHPPAVGGLYGCAGNAVADGDPNPDPNFDCRADDRPGGGNRHPRRTGGDAHRGATQSDTDAAQRRRAIRNADAAFAICRDARSTAADGHAVAAADHARQPNDPPQPDRPAPASFHRDRAEH
jgi:hypothetical protein